MKKQIFADLGECRACLSCENACSGEHYPTKNTLSALLAGEPSRIFVQAHDGSPIPVTCRHCEEPVCVDACLTGAMQIDQSSGKVTVDSDTCIGCGMCVMACPFGVPQFGKDGKMQKCDFCFDRLEKGCMPACMNVCPTRALHAGPLDEISSLAARKSVNRLIRGTHPSFFI